MMNYMKSECYRTVHGKALYVTAAILAGIVLAFQLALLAGLKLEPQFPYGTVRFSLNFFTAVPYLTVVLGALVPGCLFTEDRRHGVMKTTVAYGISREKILIGKCIVAFLFALLLLCSTVVIYIGSAWLMLEKPEAEPVLQMLKSIVFALPSATAALIFMSLLVSVFAKDMPAVMWWSALYYILPMICSLLGIKFDLFARISSWLPYSFLREEVLVKYTGGYQCLWDTAEGAVRCVGSGVLGCVIFLGFGIWYFRKQEF